MVEVNVKNIEKESISRLTFLDEEVLTTDFERNMRSRNLFRAMILGNTYKMKAKITFSSNDAINQVHTTIWATTEKYVILKRGVVIPISSILDIEMA